MAIFHDFTVYFRRGYKITSRSKIAKFLRFKATSRDSLGYIAPTGLSRISGFLPFMLPCCLQPASPGQQRIQGSLDGATAHNPLGFAAVVRCLLVNHAKPPSAMNPFPWGSFPDCAPILYNFHNFSCMTFHDFARPSTTFLHPSCFAFPISTPSCAGCASACAPTFQRAQRSIEKHYLLWGQIL